MNKPIIVLDSGIGGLDILKTLREGLPAEDFHYLADNKNVPYGDKSKQELESIGLDLVKEAELNDAKMIVIACNTLSLNAIDIMREHTSIPIYGIVRPTIKGFLNHNVDSVLVLATPATIKSQRYLDFLKELAPNIKVYQQEAKELALCIENNDIDSLDGLIKSYLDPYQDKINAVILGCTHYPIVQERFEQLYPALLFNNARLQMLQLVSDKLTLHQIKNQEDNKGSITIEATGSLNDLIKASHYFFDYEQPNIYLKEAK